MPNDPTDGIDWDSYNQAVYSEHNLSEKFDLAVQAKDYLESHTMAALRSIVALSVHGVNESVRLKAATWIAERTVTNSGTGIKEGESRIKALMKDSTPS